MRRMDATEKGKIKRMRENKREEVVVVVLLNCAQSTISDKDEDDYETLLDEKS